MKTYAMPIRASATVLLSLQVTLSSAACVDDGVAAFDSSRRAVSLCLSDHCETAVLSRSCGNIRYTSQSYDSGSDTWLFRVRFQQDGNDDDEHHVSLNGLTIPHAEIQQVTCFSQHDESGCEFIDEVLNHIFTE
jgi:hypothetical protein